MRTMKKATMPTMIRAVMSGVFIVVQARLVEMAMEGSVRILTLNAHQGFGAQGRRHALLRIRDALRATGADLVFLQEVGVAHGAEAPAEQYEVLADGIWKAHAYGRNAIKTSGHHGNAVLSKYPIVSWE